MTIRRADFVDIPDIAALAGRFLEKSRYRAAQIDEATLKMLLFQCIAGHGSDGVGSTCVFVSERDAEITGVIIGILHPLYEATDMLMATDLFWVSDGRPKDGARLLAAMHEWAKSDPGCAIIRQAVVDAVIPAERTAALLHRVGMTKTGYIYEMEVQK